MFEDQYLQASIQLKDPFGSGPFSCNLYSDDNSELAKFFRTFIRSYESAKGPRKIEISWEFFMELPKRTLEVDIRNALLGVLSQTRSRV